MLLRGGGALAAFLPMKVAQYRLHLVNAFSAE